MKYRDRVRIATILGVISFALAIYGFANPNSKFTIIGSAAVLIFVTMLIWGKPYTIYLKLFFAFIFFAIFYFSYLA